MRRWKHSFYAIVFAFRLSFRTTGFHSTPLHPAPGNQAQEESRQNAEAQPNAQMPVFRVNVYARSAKAVNYRNRGGSTTMDMKGTDMEPEITPAAPKWTAKPGGWQSMWN